MTTVNYTVRRERFFILLSRIPFTREYYLRSQFTRLFHHAITSLFSDSAELALPEMRDRFQHHIIELALEVTGGNKRHTAALLNIGQATLHRKIGLFRSNHGPV